MVYFEIGTDPLHSALDWIHCSHRVCICDTLQSFHFSGLRGMKRNVSLLCWQQSPVLYVMVYYMLHDVDKKSYYYFKLHGVKCSDFIYGIFLKKKLKFCFHFKLVVGTHSTWAVISNLNNVTLLYVITWKHIINKISSFL